MALTTYTAGEVLTAASLNDNLALRGDCACLYAGWACAYAAVIGWKNWCE
jgi:hypothetical protein